MRRNRRRKYGSFLYFILFIIVIGVGVYAVIHTLTQKKTTLVSPLPTIQQNVLSNTIFLNEYPDSKLLEGVVQNELVGTSGIYGIVVLNLKTHESYYVNEHKIYKAGSLYKLWILGTVYEQLYQGKLKKSDILSENLITLYDSFSLDSSSLEEKDEKITLSVGDALDKMITISDNDAALLLTKKVRLSTVGQFLQKQGFLESKVGIRGEAPTTTPYDVALFFEKLYGGKLFDPISTEEILTLLRRQRLNEKIPKYLPDTISVAHKTGELDEFTHDAGIVFTPDQDYIIVVLSESNSRDQSNERIANVSQAVYTYFNNETK